MNEIEDFDNKFFLASVDYRPKKGQILARFRAKVDFIDSDIKKNVVELLASNKNGAKIASRILCKLVHIPEKESFVLMKKILLDLREKTIDKVLEKPYRTMIQQLYWTKREYVPDDVHWDTIEMKFVDKEDTNDSNIVAIDQSRI